MPAVGSGRRAQASASSLRGDEPEELLLDDVGDLADAALEDRDLLEQRRLDAPVAVAGRKVGGQALERGVRRVGRQIARAARCAEGGHAGV